MHTNFNAIAPNGLCAILADCLQMQATKNKVEERYLRPIARELAIGLDAVHKASVIHRDIKGMFRTFLTESRVIVDWGDWD